MCARGETGNCPLPPPARGEGRRTGPGHPGGLSGDGLDLRLFHRCGQGHLRREDGVSHLAVRDPAVPELDTDQTLREEAYGDLLRSGWRNIWMGALLIAVILGTMRWAVWDHPQQFLL